ncbi:MAG TPA: ABC transporter permease [Verrucomicrobiae bacterium]|nr:ABC transporter permease [Verrucomicrobiae bacterium]
MVAPMYAFFLRRIRSLAVALFVASIAVFLLVRAVPGDPATLLLKNPTPERLAAIRARLGLDRPLPVQYWRWISTVIGRGSFGESAVTGRDVKEDLARTWPATIELSMVALALATIAGVWLGIFCARHAGTWKDALGTTVSLVGLSVPVFWLGLLAMLLFSLELGWLPAGERGGLDHLILPALVLATIPAAFVARVTRTAVLDTLGQDFIRTAHAKGATERTVLYRHALRAALVPIVTMIGVEFAYLLGGAVLTETVFAWPGIGRYIATAVLSRDYPAIQGALLVLVAMVMAANFVVDALHYALEPKLRQ